MASLQCRCGAVSILFSSQSPKADFECCCVDCYDKNVYSCEAGGVACPEGFGEHGVGRPMHLVYFDNSFTVQSGRENISFNRLREGARSTNMVASCCKALLCVDNPGYRGNSVLLFPDFCDLRGTPPLKEPGCRIFTKDWPVDAFVQLPPKPGVWFENGELHGEREGDKAVGAKHVAELQAAMVDSGGETFQQLLDALAGAVECLGLAEGANSRSKKAQVGGRNKIESE